MSQKDIEEFTAYVATDEALQARLKVTEGTQRSFMAVHGWLIGVVCVIILLFVKAVVSWA